MNAVHRSYHLLAIVDIVQAVLVGLESLFRSIYATYLIFASIRNYIHPTCIFGSFAGTCWLYQILLLSNIKGIFSNQFINSIGVCAYYAFFFETCS